MYQFPDNYNEHLKQICYEESLLFECTSEEVISTYITTKNFQTWWLTENENIQSSKSGIYFRHYNAAAYSDYLSALHVTKLNLSLKTGVPLEHWGHGIVVLLEKEFGSIYINKLKAICLIEAEFNWLQKTIFVKQAMHQSHVLVLIPPE